MRTCIQIGLHRSAEYAYLINPTWQIYVPDDPLKTLPCELRKTAGQWRYIGVDRNPASIAYMKEQYGYNPNMHWVCTTVGLGTEQVSIDNLIRMYRIDSLDVLAIDIEGGEQIILKDFSWEIKPHYLAVEVHTCYGVSKTEFVSFIEEQGYRLINRKLTNNGNTLECQFLQK